MTHSNSYLILFSLFCKHTTSINNAKRYPNINFIGIEKYDSVVAKCLPKIDDDLKNLLIVRMDALEIDKVFDHEISRIYLNFSDPWPKVRHHLRRLSSKIFLEKYNYIFKDNMEIYMRTDNRDLYTYSLESFSQNGYSLYDINLDLHNSIENLEDIITTEYVYKSLLSVLIYISILSLKI